jgi:hypothetical protein
LQNFIASSDRGKAWNIRAYAQVLHTEDVLKLKLNPTRFQAMPPYYANALEAWHNINPLVNPNIQSVADQRRAPIQKSTLLTPHISDHTLEFHETWTTLNVFYVGYLLMENGHWKHIHGIDTERCTIPTISSLAENLKTAKAFSAIAVETYHCISSL